jgi:hypothetical protein
MPKPAGPPPFAPVEELDAALFAPAQRALRWEWLIGLLLVAGIFGFGGWQWWDQQTRLNAYHAGVRAAAAQDWEAASSAYSAAGSYANAPALAADAARQIAERDRLYAAVQRGLATGDAADALLAARQAAAIAPRYRDLPRLQEEAAQQVYAAALSGTIALRPTASPPGLYHYGAAGWERISGSDAESRVRGICSDGTVLFDGPVLGPPLPPLPGPPGDPTGERTLFRGIWGSGAPPHVALAPVLMDFSQHLCGPAGVWGIGYPNAGNLVLLLRSLLNTTPQLAFEPGGDTRIVNPNLSALDQSHWSAVAVAPDASGIVVAKPDFYDPANPRIRVFVADPDGSRRALTDLAGAPPGNALEISGSYSPDGRYIVLNIVRYIRRDSAIPERYKTVLLIAADGKTPAHTLADVLLDDAHRDTDLGAGATFIQTGRDAGRILLVVNEAPHAHAWLLDPARPTLTAPRLTLERVNAATVSVYPDPYSPAIVLSWYRSDSPDREHPTVIAVLDPAGTVRVVHTAVDLRSYATLLAVRAGRLIWAAPATIGTPYRVRSLPLAGLPDPLPASPAIYTSGPVPSARVFPDAGRRLGAELLAYVTPTGELHARTYDGTADLLLESGVTALYSADPPEETYFLQ